MIGQRFTRPKHRHLRGDRHGARGVVVWTLFVAMALLAPVSEADEATAAGGTSDSNQRQASPDGTGTLARPDDVEATLWARLVAIDKRAAGHQDLSATFVQHRFTPLLKKPLRSSGRVWVKADRAFWRTVAPRPSAMAIRAGQVRIHLPEQNVVEVYDADHRIAPLIASPLPRLGAIASRFRIACGPEPSVGSPPADHADHAPPSPPSPPQDPKLHLRLTPRTEALAAHLSHVELSLDPARAVAERLTLVDPEGERTVITFTEIQINRGVTDAQLELSVPPGTEVVQPLRKLESAGAAPADEGPGSGSKP